MRAHEAGQCVVHAVGNSGGDPFGFVPRSSEKSRLCLECEDRMRSDLLLVANRWDAVQEAMLPGQGGSGRSATSVSAPLPLRVDVVDAVRDAGAAIVQIMILLLDTYPDIRKPEDDSTPGLAEWLAKWKMIQISQMQLGEDVLSAYWHAAEAAEAIAKVTVADALTTVLPVPDLCKALVKTEDGGQAQCGGELATIMDNHTKDKTVVCTKNRSHMIPWDSWAKSMAARRPRGARPRKQVAI